MKSMYLVHLAMVFQLKKQQLEKQPYLIGGGIGVPPLYELSKQLTAKGVKCIHVLGFQSKDVVFYEEEFSELGETHIVTVDGTQGTAGFVTTVMEKLGNEFSTYYSCGPMPMLDAVAKHVRGKKGFLVFRTTDGLRNWCLFRMCLSNNGRIRKSIHKSMFRRSSLSSRGGGNMNRLSVELPGLSIEKSDYAGIRLFRIW